MLQQTRASAVIPYYERFLERFPDVTSLTSASEHELLAAWAGLGYYSRARNLKRAAHVISELGHFPRDYASLLGLPGVGDYTAAAIASIAFDAPCAVLDGNVIRVLSRLTGERGNVGSLPVRERLREVANRILDPRQPGDFNQALMELGATVCLPKRPLCAACPLGRTCAAHQLGQQNDLPIKTRRPAPQRVEKELIIIEKTGAILFWQRSTNHRRMAGFWELPERSQLPAARLRSRVGRFRHTIVNTSFDFQVFRGKLARVPKGFCWLDRRKLRQIPLSTTAKKALAFLISK